MECEVPEREEHDASLNCQAGAGNIALQVETNDIRDLQHFQTARLVPIASDNVVLKFFGTEGASCKLYLAVADGRVPFSDGTPVFLNLPHFSTAVTVPEASKSVCSGCEDP